MNRRRLLIVLVQTVVTYVLLRALVSLAISSGSQSLWAIAAATCACVALGGSLTAAALSRVVDAGVPRELLLVPALGAVWTGSEVAMRGGTPPQVSVAAAAWVLGGILAVAIARWQARRAARRRRAIP